jgi:hypothetical protein
MNAPDLTQVWSCGGGTQSGAIATLIKLGKLPTPDYAFMIDTGRERASTWPFVDGFIRPALAEVGLELTIVKTADFTDHLDAFYKNQQGELTILLPGFTNSNGQKGKLSPFCSGKWKRDVAERWMRSKGIQKARNWIGISRDEASRMRAQHRGWLQIWYPLIFDVPMTRPRCVELIRQQGWTDVVPHSACYMCSNQSDAEWLDMKVNHPRDFVAACVFEQEIRRTDPNFYLHATLQPLSQVDFTGQHTMFGDLGCSTGCFT